jgi:hypothetical protein
VENKNTLEIYKYIILKSHYKSTIQVNGMPKRKEAFTLFTKSKNGLPKTVKTLPMLKRIPIQIERTTTNLK